MPIVIKNLSKDFGNKAALKDVTMTFEKNKITGLIGFNGSGKTTTFNILVKFIESYKGDVTIGGSEVDLSIRKTITYLAAGSEPKNTTKAIKQLKTIAYMYGADKDWAIERINKYAKAFDFEEFLDSPIKSLSKGNQQKIKLIASFLNPNCKYIFLDEPFDGLDPIMVKKVQKEYVALKDTTIIITSHRMEIVQEMTHEFFVLKEGVLVDAKKTNDGTVVIRVNKEVPLTAASKMKEVISTKKGIKYNELTIKSIADFKKVNLVLIKRKEYIHSSLADKDISSSVFDKYGVKND